MQVAVNVRIYIIANKWHVQKLFRVSVILAMPIPAQLRQQSRQ